MAKKTIYDLKDEIANEIEEEEVIEEVVVVKAPVQPTSFRSLKAAKAYAKANGGTVKEKGKFFYVR